MRTALWGGNQVDIALGEGLAVLDEPGEGPVHRLVRAFQAPRVRLAGDALQAGEGLAEIPREAVFITPFHLFAAVFVIEAHRETGA